MAKKITTKLEVLMTAEEVVEYNEMVERNTEKDGLMDKTCDDYKWNRCPNCNYAFLSGIKYCNNCGQKVRFVDYSTIDVIPL